jgi:hypothetical protein
MRSTNYGYLFNLYRYKTLTIIAVLFLFAISQTSFAQRGGGANFNFNAFNKKTYYFGISLGYNNSYYRIVHDRSFILNDTVKILESARGPGFNLGIVTNIKFGENFDFRFNLPTLSFAERRFEYTLTSKEVQKRKVESVFIDFPIQFRYKSKPYHDIRAFVIFGGKYSIDLASNSRARQADDLIKIQRQDLLLEYGVGFQVFFPYFILSPEIKFSHGLLNIHDRNAGLVYSRVIDRLLARGLTISFHFEG